MPIYVTGEEGSGSSGTEINSSLNIKYGTKTGTGNVIKASLEEGHEGEEDLDIAGGTIYAAENSVGQIEMYIDTPKSVGAARKRLDPRIFVGGLNDVNTAGTAADKRAAIWDNYDVWIDTDAEPDQSLDVLSQLKLQVVTYNYWNDTEKPRNKTDTSNLTGLLTIVLPNSASNATNQEECFLYINTDAPSASLGVGD